MEYKLNKDNISKSFPEKEMYAGYKAGVVDKDGGGSDSAKKSDLREKIKMRKTIKGSITNRIIKKN